MSPERDSRSDTSFGLEETPFLRPRSRTRVRRPRRGSLASWAVALQGTAAVLFLFTLWLGYSRVMSSDRLRVARVEVKGSRFLSEGEVRELLGRAVGENILALDIGELKTRLRASPWVADAVVRRTLPDTLRVEIRERVPVALAEVDRLYLMDGEGVLLELYGPRTAGFDLPIVRGLAGLEVERRGAQASRVATLLADVGSLQIHVSELRVADAEIEAVLAGEGEVLRLGDPPYAHKLATFLRLRNDLKRRSPGADYYDLRFRDRIVAKGPDPAAATTVGDGKEGR